ncbi:germin-like protein subfamily 1 member 11 isoform X2 [Prunus yedoensis var. nudiflora]|uniref:Germin-like protein n=1 Tax=Prunus yedoensis var. nudiflora TaxID=2094558 RepID=A0A314YJJ5_PRUYE|nr:germin-like protein subfamily 1 member 11 isoform X2 [Prunus yedoensis var. nudiflora]
MWVPFRLGGYFGAGAVRECGQPTRIEHSRLSLARIDFAPNGLNPPHTHPRATEILVVLEGTLYVGFVTSNGDGNRLFTKVLNKGDVFVFPIGLIHFQLNVGKVNAVAFAGLSSQNPGVITIAKAVFGSQPPINPDVLAKAFQVDDNVVDYLQKQFWYDNN